MQLSSSSAVTEKLRSEFASVFAVSAGIAAGITATIEIALRVLFLLAPQIILE